MGIEGKEKLSVEDAKDVGLELLFCRSRDDFERRYHPGATASKESSCPD